MMMNKLNKKLVLMSLTIASSLIVGCGEQLSLLTALAPTDGSTSTIGDTFTNVVNPSSKGEKARHKDNKPSNILLPTGASDLAGDIAEPELQAPKPLPSAAPTVAPTSAPQASATPTPTPTASATPDLTATDFFYFSYDDSASTVGVELTKNAFKNNFAPSPSWARPYEFLNYESFSKNNLEAQGLFKVSMGLWKHADVENPATDNYELGVHVVAPDISKADRKNAVITLVVDTSGSMDTSSPVADLDNRRSSLLGLAKRGMKAMTNSLKEGDIINIVDFSDDARVVIDGMAYSEAKKNNYLQTIDFIGTRGGTNLDAGIEMAYKKAQEHYDPNKINRVIMLTDAFANIGEVNSSIISQKTEINNLEGIYFSGLGFGQGFNEAFLNELTEKGRGAYYSVVTEKDAERAFQERFMALLNVAARNVQFRLDFPAALKQIQSAAEESSKIQSEVQPTNFSYNTSQYFWEQFAADGETNLNEQHFKLSIFYTDPKTNQKQTVEVKKTVSELLGQDLPNIKDAHMITLLNLLIKNDVSEERAQKELDTLLSDHSSALASEYRKYIETLFSLRITP